MKGKFYWVCGEEWSDNDLNQLKCISWWPKQPGEGERESQSRSWLFWFRHWWRRWLTLLGRPWSAQTPLRIRWVGWCSSTGQDRLTWPDQHLWSSQLYLRGEGHIIDSVGHENAWNRPLNVTYDFVHLHVTCRRQVLDCWLKGTSENWIPSQWSSTYTYLWKNGTCLFSLLPWN